MLFITRFMLANVTSAAIVVVLLIASSVAFARPFVIGKISDNPKKHYGYLKPMADYIAKHLESFGYTEGKVLMASNNSQMIQYLNEGKIDLVTETLFSAVALEEGSGAKIILTKWKKSVSSYYSIVFVRQDSGIESLADLQGRLIAFEDKGSTSAFFVPAAELLTAGLTLTEIDSARSERHTEKVNYIFSGDEINTSIMVHKKIVDAGAYNDHDWDKDDHMPKKLRSSLKIIHRSRSLPRAVELIAKSVSDPVKDEVITILTTIHKDPSAERILKAYQRTTKFEPLTEDFTYHRQYAKSVLTTVENHLGRSE